MMREWATVVSWKDGVVTLHMEVKTSCNSCSARKKCGSNMLNKLWPKNIHVMEIASSEPLLPGQRIELGICESSLLCSAMLVYMTPLFGLFLLACVFHKIFHGDFTVACGALLGGIGGFIVAKGLYSLFDGRAMFQPVILRIERPQKLLLDNNS